MTALDVARTIIGAVPTWATLPVLVFASIYLLLRWWAGREAQIYSRGVRDGIEATLSPTVDELPPWPERPPIRGRS